MKEPDERAQPYFCSKCGQKTGVRDDAEPFYDVRNGMPHYYVVDQICPTHGELHKRHKPAPRLFGIPLWSDDI